MKRITKVLAGTALTGLVTALAVVPTGGAGAAVLPNCTPATNISAIIDDSSSMLGTDPTKLRSSLVEIIAGSGLMKGKQMSALEFGSEGANPNSAAAVLIGPTPIGDAGAQNTFTSVLGGAIFGNGPVGGSSGTNYDAGFALSNTSNPGANARLFLSDGEPNAGTYNPAGPSVMPPTKTFVVGLTVAASPALNQIAANTGGPPVFPANTAADLGVVTGDVVAAMNCKTAPPRITDVLTRPNQVKKHSFKAQSNVADILTTWSTTGTVIATTPSNKSAGLTATAAKKKKVKSRSQKGTTFSAIHLTGLKKGKKYKFKVKAKTLLGTTTATSQVIQ